MTDNAFNRREAMQFGMGGLVLTSTAGAATAQTAKPAAARPFLSDTDMWETFGGRAIGRIVEAAAEIGECRAAVEATGDGGPDAWYAAWTAIADRLAGEAEASFAKGRKASAREAWLRAATYYQVAYFPLYGAPVDPRLIAAFDKETAAFHKSIALSEYLIEPVEIPYQGITLPGYFARPDASGQPRPTIVFTNGYDSNIQEMFMNQAPAALRRGYNCLAFDGPGQGRVLYKQGITMRPDWEAVVTPVIDYAMTLPEVDPQKVALVGWSLGGFLAPRAAAFEHRIAALIADPGQGDQRDALLAALPLDAAAKAAFPNIDPHLLDGLAAFLNSPKADPMLRWKMIQRGQWVHGTDNLFDTAKALASFEVLSVAPQISCPTLLTAGEGDPTAAGGVDLLAALTVENKQRYFFSAAEGAGGHCEAFNRSLYNQRALDWLDEVLGMQPI